MVGIAADAAGEGETEDRVQGGVREEGICLVSGVDLLSFTRGFIIKNFLKEDTMEQIIRNAINEKHLVEFMYQGLQRIAEVHVYGVKDGIRQMLVYQVRGQSRSGRLPDWRRVNLREVINLRLIDENFPGRRPNPSRNHSEWDQIIALVN